MKKLFMVLCVVIMFFGIVGCPGDDAQFTSRTPNVFKKIGNDDSGGSGAFPVSGDTDGSPVDGNTGGSTVPEPASLILLGTGLVGLAGVGRKKFFKKD